MVEERFEISSVVDEENMRVDWIGQMI